MSSTCTFVTMKHTVPLPTSFGVQYQMKRDRRERVVMLCAYHIAASVISPPPAATGSSSTSARAASHGRVDAIAAP